MAPPFAGSSDWRAPRFILRTDQPSAYWIGLRVPFVTPERGGRTPPALLVARVGSFWKLLHLIGLESWFLAAGGVLALSVLFWLPLVRSITHPLAQLTAATGRIAEGRLDTRVDASRRDELGHLGEAVNRMAARLEAQQHGQNSQEEEQNRWGEQVLQDQARVHRRAAAEPHARRRVGQCSRTHTRMPRAVVACGNRSYG